MTSEQVAEAVVAWAAAELPALQGTYAHADPERTTALPDVMAFVTGLRVADTPASSMTPRLGGTQQALVNVRDLKVIFAVDPTDPDIASEQLEAFADTLTDAVRADYTLGGRLQDGGANPLVSWNFDPPFIEFDDGVRARQATLTLQVAHPVPVRSPIHA